MKYRMRSMAPPAGQFCRVRDNSLVAHFQQVLAGRSADWFPFGSAKGFGSLAALRFA